ncbi:MAG: MarR family EPS-associated transcriptional regulator [Nevskiaceae bacterium]|nr:MAG: MarR family EPS-associated transcriptional regulator [Nevskiaceae bacterium]TBR73866.1 MAG: MarR family EPS-associated transcriptional regulator [Nevskiaceae bacterium]
MVERAITDETRYRLLQRLAENPELSQRELAQHFGISVGKVNYCLKALLEKGYIKAENFKNSQNKIGYLYLLTPAGVAAKSLATLHFLQRKQAEYERLAQEIAELRAEVHRS